MNFRAIISYASHTLKAEAVFMLIPLAISLYEREAKAVNGFVITIAIMMGISLAVDILIGRGKKNITAKDGLSLVAVCWVLLSAFGALPYWFCGEFKSYIDCLFESISGFTTTGFTVLTDVEVLSHGLLFWRSFTHWIGGMGILVLLLAIVPNMTGENSMNVLKAESPGPSPGRLVPSIKQSAKILYIMYLGLTAVQIVLYIIGGMPVFDSVCNTFSTAGTGGFALYNASIGQYNSLYVEVVTTVFMILFGVNFNLYYLLFLKNIKSVLKSEELRGYIGIIAGAVIIVSLNLFGTVINTLSGAFRLGSFHVASVITTTGFTTADMSGWPQLTKTVLLTLMFVGACGGSTGGGIKVSRVIILFKEMKRIMFRMSHPRAYETVKLDGKALDKAVVHGTNVYFITFALIFAVSILIISVDNFDFTTNFVYVASCINNVGTAAGLSDSAMNPAYYSSLSKIILCLDMLLGRLEIYPMLLLFARSTWSKL